MIWLKGVALFLGVTVSIVALLEDAAGTAVVCFAVTMWVLFGNKSKDE